MLTYCEMRKEVEQALANGEDLHLQRLKIMDRNMYAEVMRQITYFEVDLRDKKSGKSVETIYSGTDHEQAYEVADKWNKTNDTGLFADVIHIENAADRHGIGRF